MISVSHLTALDASPEAFLDHAAAAGFDAVSPQADLVCLGEMGIANTTTAAAVAAALFGGGLPIIAEGTVIGGIGVSGASADQDEDCAQAGLGAIGLG